MEEVIHIQADVLVVRMPAKGVAPSWLSMPFEELGLTSCEGVRRLRLEHPREWRWSSLDAAFLARLLRRLGPIFPDTSALGVPPDMKRLLSLVATGSPVRDPDEARESRLVQRIGSRALQVLREFSSLLAVVGDIVLRVPRFVSGRARVPRSELAEVFADCGSRALAIVLIVNVLMGSILAFVGAVQLRRFGAGIYIADLVGIASVRELTPIITGIVLAGRTGAGFAARIATMQGNEEVDALITLGVSPVEFLVVPRVVALTLLMPVLYVYGWISAMLGGLWVCGPILDLSPAAYWGEMHAAIAGANFAIGALKSAVFGAMVSLIGCYCGLRAERSATGVGSATTGSVVASIVAIIAVDAVFALCANALNI